MNTRLLTVVITVTAAVSLPAVAGRDGTQISQQEKANQAVAEQHAQEAARSSKAATKIVLLLNHGPHVQTTPWNNKQRLLRAEAAAKGVATPGTTSK